MINMENKKKKKPLVAAISDLKEDLAIDIVKKHLASNKDPIALIAECQEGLRLVGQRYENQEYFLAGLIMGGEIFKEVTELIQNTMKDPKSNKTNRAIVLIGTVAGDIHDLGKDIVKMLLKGHNFSVFDLGVDVPPSLFLDQAKAIQPDIIGLSGLIMNSYESMGETIQALRDGGIITPIIIGGSLLSETVFKHTGADYWTTDANTGVEICKQLVSSPKSKDDK